MAALAHALPVLVNVTVAALVFALGLNAHFEDVIALWRQPGLLLRSLVAMDVVVPVAAVLLVQLMAPAQPVALGVLALAIAPGAPFTPQKGVRVGGRGSFIYGLLVTVALLSVVTIPLSIRLLRVVLGGEREGLLTWAQVARVVLITVLAPLLVGMLTHRALPSLAARIARPIAFVANLLLVAILLLIVIKALPGMMALGGRAFLLMALLTVVSVTAGHLLGGPQPEDRAALAVASPLRHPGLALLIARVEVPGQPVVAVLVAYLLVGRLVSIPYTMWQKRRRLAEAEVGTRAPAPAAPRGPA